MLEVHKELFLMYRTRLHYYSAMFILVDSCRSVRQLILDEECSSSFAQSRETVVGNADRVPFAVDFGGLPCTIVEQLFFFILL